MFGSKEGEGEGWGEMKGVGRLYWSLILFGMINRKERIEDINVIKNLLVSYQMSPSYNSFNIGGVDLEGLGWIPHSSSHPLPPPIPPTKQSSHFSFLHHSLSLPHSLISNRLLIYNLLIDPCFLVFPFTYNSFIRSVKLKIKIKIWNSLINLTNFYEKSTCLLVAVW